MTRTRQPFAPLVSESLPSMPSKFPFGASDIAITSRIPYPTAGEEVDPKDETESIVWGIGGKDALVNILATVSDCLYPYELNNDFHDDDMKIAYLTMKRSWERYGDTVPFLTMASKKRMVLNWFQIALIWCFVLPKNDAYWADYFNPPEIWEGKEQLLDAMKNVIPFRDSWKLLHEQKVLTSMSVSLSKDGFVIRLYKKK